LHWLRHRGASRSAAAHVGSDHPADFGHKARTARASRPDRQRRIKRASLARPSTSTVKTGGPTRPPYCFTR
jgi:hypothetical protein